MEEATGFSETEFESPRNAEVDDGPYILSSLKSPPRFLVARVVVNAARMNNAGVILSDDLGGSRGCIAMTRRYESNPPGRWHDNNTAHNMTSR